MQCISAWTIFLNELLTVLIYDTPHCYRILACACTRYSISNRLEGNISETWREQSYVLDYAHTIADSFFADRKTILLFIQNISPILIG